MKETDYETWEEIGAQTKRVDAELHELSRLLSGNVPKSEYRDQLHRAEDALSKVRSDLEDRLAKEHPDDWEVDDFYGTDDVTPHRQLDEK